jgi:hypothetical protein
MRDLFIIAITISLSMPIFSGSAQSADSCPLGFQVVYDINKAFCIASFNFKEGACPSNSKVFTMDGRHLCLHNQSPNQEGKAPVSRVESEPVPVPPRLIQN